MGAQDRERDRRRRELLHRAEKLQREDGAHLGEPAAGEPEIEQILGPRDVGSGLVRLIERGQNVARDSPELARIEASGDVAVRATGVTEIVMPELVTEDESRHLVEDDALAGELARIVRFDAVETGRRIGRRRSMRRRVGGELRIRVDVSTARELIGSLRLRDVPDDAKERNGERHVRLAVLAPRERVHFARLCVDQERYPRDALTLRLRKRGDEALKEVCGLGLLEREGEKASAVDRSRRERRRGRRRRRHRHRRRLPRGTGRDRRRGAPREPGRERHRHREPGNPRGRLRLRLRICAGRGGERSEREERSDAGVHRGSQSVPARPTFVPLAGSAPFR